MQPSYLSKLKPVTTPSYASKLVPVKSGDFQYDVPKTAQDKKNNIQADIAASNAEVKKNSGLGNILKNTVKGTVSTIVSSEVGLGKTLAKTFGNQSQKYVDAGVQTEQTKVDLIKRIREKKARGEDVTSLQQAYNRLVPESEKLKADLAEETKLPSNLEAAGQLGGTALDLLTAGTYGAATKGMKAGILAKTAAGGKTAAKVVETAVSPELTKVAEIAGDKTKSAAVKIAQGAGIGYASDVTQGLQGNRGEDRTGVKAFIPGLGTAIGGAIPGAVAGAKSAKGSFKQFKAIDELEEKYSEWMSGTTPGKKKVDKIAVKTENLDRAGTSGRSPQRVLAESGIIPEREGAKLSTFEQAKQFRETTAPLREANRQALQEVGLSTAPLKLDDLEARAISNAKTSANVDGGRFESMERQIKARFEALKRAYPSGEIPLSKVDDIKAATWENVFGNKSLVEVDKLAKDSDYAIAKSLQKTIEETAEKAGHKEVAQLNREIGDRLEASRFLEELNGKTVKGGRLLKYMTTLVGSSLGTTLPGKLIGAIGGNVIGDLIIANSVSNPIKRMLLKNLATKDPEAYTKTIAWLQKQNLDRETRLLLPEGKAPAPAPIYVTPNGVATPAASEAADIAAVEAGKAKAPAAGPGIKNKLPGFLTPEPYIAPKDLPIIETGKKIPKSILPTAKGAPNAYIPEGAKPYGLGKDIQFGQLKSPKSQQTKPAIKMVANMPIEEMLSHTEKNVSKVILEQIKERVKLLKENKVSEKEIREFIQKATTDPNFKF